MGIAFMMSCMMMKLTDRNAAFPALKSLAHVQGLVQHHQLWWPVVAMASKQVVQAQRQMKLAHTLGDQAYHQCTTSGEDEIYCSVWVRERQVLHVPGNDNVSPTSNNN